MDGSRRTLLVLLLMLGATWFWKSRSEEADDSPLAYSQLFAWAQQGKIESVVISGDAVDGTLKKAESLDGETVQAFHCDLPPNDPTLLPVLREKGAKIVVKSQKQPFAVQLVLTLLPWALIMAAWIWMSRRARGMLGAGGPLGGLMKGPGRRFDKATSVNVTFDDIAGLKSAKEVEGTTSGSRR